MIDAVDLAAAEETEVVNDLGQMLPVLGDVGSGLSCFAKLERAADVVPSAAFHGGLLFAFTDELLEVQFVQRRLGVEGVDV